MLDKRTAPTITVDANKWFILGFLILLRVINSIIIGITIRSDRFNIFTIRLLNDVYLQTNQLILSQDNPVNNINIAPGEKDFDSIVKTLIASALVGLSVFVININADVKVQGNRIAHIEASQKESIEVTKELTKAVVDLRIVIETIRK